MQRAKKRNSPESPMKQRRSASIPGHHPNYSTSGIPTSYISRCLPITNQTQRIVPAPSAPDLQEGSRHQSFIANSMRPCNNSSTKIMHINHGNSSDSDLLKILAAEAEKEAWLMVRSKAKFYRLQSARIPKRCTKSCIECTSNEDLRLKSAAKNTSNGDCLFAKENEHLRQHSEYEKGTNLKVENGKEDGGGEQGMIMDDDDGISSGHPANVPIDTVKSGSIVEYIHCNGSGLASCSAASAMYAIIQHIFIDSLNEIYFLPIPLKPKIASRRGSCLRIEDLEVEQETVQPLDNIPITYSILQPITSINKIIVY